MCIRDRVSLYHVFPQLVIIVIAALFYGWSPTLSGFAAFLIAMLLMGVLGTACALVCSAANVFFRDIGSAVGIMTNLIRFSVPMIYSYSMVDERFGRFADYYVLNPIADAVMLFQQAFWIPTISDAKLAEQERLPGNLLELGLIGLGVSLVLLVLAQLLFNKLDDRIPDRLT